MAIDPQELVAANPDPVDRDRFNPNTVLPFGLTIDHMASAMESFVHFLGFINGQLVTQGIPRLESMMMPANFSSIVSEYMKSNIPKFNPALARNTYHNGHPDLVPAGLFPRDAAQHAQDGIEVKGSRYSRGWQGHNAEDCWLMVFVFDANRDSDVANGIPPRPFRFLGVIGAAILASDWKFSGRSETSRRTPTANVTPSGRDKMVANWIYRIPGSGL